MSNLTASNLARLNAALDKQYQFSDGIGSYRTRIANGVYSHGVKASVPKAVYNRRKWNRMWTREQAIYQKQLDSTKTEYHLYLTSDSDCFQTVPKMVFEYFNTQQNGV